MRFVANFTLFLAVKKFEDGYVLTKLNRTHFCDTVYVIFCKYLFIFCRN